MFKKALAIGALIVLPIGMANADEAALAGDDGPIVEAIKGGKPILDVRYRFEMTEQTGFVEDAAAHTVRTRLGYETGEAYHFKILVEFENVFSIGDDNFNSTTNGQTQFPVIADPDATEINRAQLTFTAIEKTPITVGRQRFNLNNQRFVGAVDFRQNQQTFDSVRLSSTFIENLTVDYLYINRVHRIFGDDNPLGEFDSDSHVIAAAYNAGEFGTIKGYGILLDFMEAPALSSATWGVRYENMISIDAAANIKLGVIGEYASQRDYAANPFDYEEAYIHGEAALTIAPFTGKIGYEQLGGNGAIGFSTPLSTLHKFQGFADLFLTTPTTGIEDIYGTISYVWPDGPLGAKLTLYTTYHDFKSELGDVSFGEEIDAGLNIKFPTNWSAEIKGAHFDSAGVLPNRNVIWASLRFQY